MYNMLSIATCSIIIIIIIMYYYYYTEHKQASHDMYSVMLGEDKGHEVSTK